MSMEFRDPMIMSQQWDGQVWVLRGDCVPRWPRHTHDPMLGFTAPASCRLRPPPHTSPKSDVESGLTVPWTAMSPQSAWKVIQRKPSIVAPRTQFFFSTPVKMPTLPAKLRCVAQRNEVEGGKSLNHKTVFIGDGRSGDSGAQESEK